MPSATCSAHCARTDSPDSLGGLVPRAAHGHMRLFLHTFHQAAGLSCHWPHRPASKSSTTALAIRQLAESTILRGNLQLVLDVPEDAENLSPDVEQTVYRIAQEAVENVLRHADAETIAVTLEFIDNRLVLCVADDGRGFTGEKAASEERMGLQVMRERAALIGGQLSISTLPGEGTGVELTVPLDK